MFKRGRYYWTTIGGVRTSLRTENKSDAEAYEAKLKHERYQQEFLGAKPPCLWEKVCVRFGKERSHKTSWHDYVRGIRWWSRFFQGRDIRSITREEVDDIIRREFEITKEASPTNNTANHYVAYIAAIFNAAAREWDWTDKSPKLCRYPATDGRKRWLSVGEWRAVHAELPDYLRLAATFALATGIRRGSLVASRWEQVALQSRSFTFAGTSNKLGNTIPLNETALYVLEEIRASKVRHKDLVFTKNGKRFQEYEPEWYRALEKAGLRGQGGEDFCWHGLRHTWASWLAQAGVPEWARKRLGGWSSREVVDRYSHLDLESLRSYAGVIDRILAGDVRKEMAG